MRLTNEQEISTKVIQVEEYNTFNALLKSKYLFYLLIAYTAFVVINAVLTILDGGYFMAVLNILVHGAICVGLWMFKLSNDKYDGSKFSIKGLKTFQIAHAVKYTIVLILLFVLIIMVVLAWINGANEAHQQVVANQNSTVEGVLAAAKAHSRKVFFSYFGLTVFTLVFSVCTLVYYKAVMKQADALVKYHEKGTHFENDLKFAAIYLFVSAFILVVMSVLCMTGLTSKLLGMVSEVDYSVIIGGLGILSSIGRILFAVLLVCLGILLLKGHKVLSTTVTYHEEVIEI